MDSAKLTPRTSGFVLAAGITVLLNTALTWTKDASVPLKAFMKSITGHDWITQGLVDLVLFVGLGLILMDTRMVERMDSNRLILGLIGAVVIAGLFFGLCLFDSLLAMEE